MGFAFVFFDKHDHIEKFKKFFNEKKYDKKIEKEIIDMKVRNW